MDSLRGAPGRVRLADGRGSPCSPKQTTEKIGQIGEGLICGACLTVDAATRLDRLGRYISINFASSSRRCPCRPVSGIEMAAIREMPHMRVTYQKNIDSTPIDLNHSATYSALPPKAALAIA